MRKYILIGLLVLLTAGSALGAGRGDGFVSLFDGKSLEGWRVAGNAEGFRVEKGCLVSDGGKGGNSIHYQEPFSNFILRMDWMLSKTGNSGVFIRNGLEVQLLAPWTPYRDDLHCTGSLYGYVPVKNRPDETTLRWRAIEITCAYKQITVAVDGQVCTEADYDRVEGLKNVPLTGFIGMQDSHTGPGEWVKFKNIKIKNLDRDPEFVAKGLTSADPAIRRSAYEAALRLGPAMVPRLLDAASGGGPEAVHTAEMAFYRITASATAPGNGGQAAAVRKALLARLARKGSPDDHARVLAARLLGWVGQGDSRTIEILKKAFAEGGAVSSAALQTLQRIPGQRAADAFQEAVRESQP
ncbi:MAG: DUF1080 domain-containing protein [Armatimonadetes bacterium]|nr:DUF1080 domain-containing protein [Armatimonadota bacterium]